MLLCGIELEPIDGLFAESIKQPMIQKEDAPRERAVAHLRFWAGPDGRPQGLFGFIRAPQLQGFAGISRGQCVAHLGHHPSFFAFETLLVALYERGAGISHPISARSRFEPPLLLQQIECSIVPKRQHSIPPVTHKAIVNCSRGGKVREKFDLGIVTHLVRLNKVSAIHFFCAKQIFQKAHRLW